MRSLIALATCVAFLLRVWPIGRLGLNQFDEGIYAFASTWTSPAHQGLMIDPVLISYAPPGYPLLVGLLSLVLGFSDYSGLLTSALCGALTVPVVAVIAQTLFGPRAGVVAAWCACFSGPHIAFSRMGLTDATFLFFWAVTFQLSLNFLRNPNIATALLMGSFVGIAQQCKYNGWLIGGFVILTALVGLLSSSAERSPGRLIRVLGWGGMAAGIACCVVYPWYRFVEDHGGYAALLQHQRSYLGGLASWWPHLLNQASQAVELSGPFNLVLVNLVVVAGSAWLMSPHAEGGRRPRVGGLVVSSGLLLPLLWAPLYAGFFLISTLQWKSCARERMLGVSWLALLILTPFYHPYARLWLPFEMLHWVWLAKMMSHWLDRFGEVDANFSEWNKVLTPRSLLAGSLLVGLFWWGPGWPLNRAGSLSHPGLFDPSDSLRIVARQIDDRIPQSVGHLRTLIRPALSTYLSGRQRLIPQRELEQFLGAGLPGSWGLIDSTILTGELAAIGDPRLQRWVAPLLQEWEIVAEIPAATTLPTALDLDPSRRNFVREHSMAYFWLLRPRLRNSVP